MQDNTLPRPNSIINESSMGLQQWLIVTICVLAMALDGYDVMSIALAASSLKEEWQLTQAQLGMILPLEFLGMAFGAIFLGSLSDNVGRQKTLLGCLVIISIGMAISGFAQNMLTMGASRIFTGLGIGGTLAAATALSSEYSNNKNRSLAVIMVAGGYTLGIYLASKFAGYLLTEYDWRAIFIFGALLSLLFFPVVFFFVPESVSQLEQKDTEKALKTIQRTLNRLGHAKAFAVERTAQIAAQSDPRELFRGTNRRVTFAVMLFYFGQIFTYYYFIKWLPPAITDLGYSKIQGTEIIATISLVGLVASFVMAGLSRIFPLKALMLISLVGAGISVAAFPYFTTSITSMHIAGGVAGFWLYAVISGAFGMFAIAFAPPILASGTGLVLGVGRGGAITGPWAAGLLFAGGMSLAGVSMMMALGSMLAAISLLMLPRGKHSNRD